MLSEQVLSLSSKPFATRLAPLLRALCSHELCTTPGFNAIAVCLLLLLFLLAAALAAAVNKYR